MTSRREIDSRLTELEDSHGDREPLTIAQILSTPDGEDPAEYWHAYMPRGLSAKVDALGDDTGGVRQ